MFRLDPASLSLFRRRAFRVKPPQLQMKSAIHSQNSMHKTLHARDLIALGIGGIIGAGVFVLTGVAAKLAAGPAVIISYLISGFAACLAALCYCQFAIDLPLAGGAFNYVAVTFGELTAWIVACNLMLEYTLSAAAVARGWTSYLAMLCGMRPSSWRFGQGVISLDPAAVIIIASISILLARGTKDSARFNAVVTGLNLICVAFVILAGLVFVRKANFVPFAPFGSRGIFAGASMVFFAFIGFDTIACTVEEVQDPARDLPLGIVGSVGICAAIYAIMAFVITGMVPYGMIDEDAPFAAAFHHAGIPWASYIVSFGAVAGITTSLLVALLGQARIYVVLGREHLLPVALARVHETRGTPVNATLLTAVTSSFFAFFIDIEVLASLVSIGTLFVFYGVCAAVLMRRYHHESSKGGPSIAAAAVVVNLHHHHHDGSNTTSMNMIDSVDALSTASQPMTVVTKSRRTLSRTSGNSTSGFENHNNNGLGIDSAALDRALASLPTSPSSPSSSATAVLASSLSSSAKPILLHLGAVTLASILFSLSFSLHAPFYIWGVFLLLVSVASMSMSRLPVVYEPPKFRVPLSPHLPVCGMLACLHLIGSLGWSAYVRFLIWLILSLAVYYFYGMRRAEAHAVHSAEEVELASKEEEAR